LPGIENTQNKKREKEGYTKSNRLIAPSEEEGGGIAVHFKFFDRLIGRKEKEDRKGAKIRDKKGKGGGQGKPPISSEKGGSTKLWSHFI